MEDIVPRDRKRGKRTPAQTVVKVKGMFHVHIMNEDGSLAGDSGPCYNTVSQDGFNSYLVKSLGSIANSSYVSFMALGTGGLINSTDTSLPGEIQKRQAVTAATSNTSKTLRLTATFSSANSFCTTTQNISNIGLFMSSAAGTIFAGNTFASSSCASNQNVNATYDITFS